MTQTNDAFTEMPAVRAACRFEPTARNLKPMVERLMSHQTNTAASTATTNPQCRRNCPPRSAGYCADSGTGGEIGLVLPGFLSTDVVSRYATRYTAMLLSMIVVMTSCAPVRALRKPAIPAHRPPATAAASIATSRCSTGGRSRWNATQPAPTAPRMICPWAPMLNRPARNPMPRPRPARISGTDVVMVSVSGLIDAANVSLLGSYTAPWNSAT